MSDIKYGIHYENYSETVINMLATLLQGQNFVDVSLVCDSKSLKVHKVVLAAISPYFYDVFKNWIGEVTILLEMNFSVLESLVEYIYMGKTCISADLIDELIAAARFFQIKGLSELKDLSEDICHFPPPKIISQSLDTLSSTSEATVNNFVFKMPIEIKKKRDLLYNDGNDERPNSHFKSLPYVDDYEEMEMRSKKIKKKSHHNKYGSDEMGIRLLNGATRKALHKEEKNSLETIQQIKKMHIMQEDDALHQFDLSDFGDSVTMTTNLLGDMECEQSIIQNNDQNIMDDSNVTLEPRYDESGNWTLESAVENTSMTEYLNELKAKDIPAADIPIMFHLEDGSNINMNEEVLLNMDHGNDIQCEVVESNNVDSFVNSCIPHDSITDML